MRSRLLHYPAPRVEARQRIERASRDVALAMTRHLPAVPRCCPTCGKVHNDLHDARTGRRNIYGALLGYLDRAVRIGTPVEVLLAIPQFLDAFIRDIAPAPLPPTAALAAA